MGGPVTRPEQVAVRLGQRVDLLRELEQRVAVVVEDPAHGAGDDRRAPAASGTRRDRAGRGLLGADRAVELQALDLRENRLDLGVA